ncbi:MAG TPA: hypothetical protein VIJ85_12065 [Rhizomicrobium sp.]
MDMDTARDWAQDFENKDEFELREMNVPGGLDDAARLEWRRARERALIARDDAERAAADPSGIADAEDLALVREEQAQQASVVGRMSTYSDPAPELDDVVPAFARPKAHVIRDDGDTEHLLSGLIAECHLLMRAVTLPSAMRAGDADTRRHFLDSAMNMAKTGAKIGRAVASLRSAGNVNSFHQKVTVEREAQMGGGTLRQNGANVNSTLNMLGPDDVWQPRMGAPRGNRNALKNGRHTKAARALRARIRDFKSRVKLALAMVDTRIVARPDTT